MKHIRMYVVASEISGLETNIVILWQVGKSVLSLHTVVSVPLD
jgi:hypothetical protein